MFLLYSIILTGILLSGSQSQDTDICTMEGTKKLCVQRDVIGVRDEDVILTCRFNHNEGNNITNLNFVWFKKYNDGYNIIFMSFTNYTHEGFKGRIQTVGNPSEGDGTVRIRDLKMEDEGRYKCGFLFYDRTQWRTLYPVGFDPSEEKVTRLRVDVRPKILDVWREFVWSSTSWRLFCEAEAKPGPNITWWNPQGLLINGNETVVSPNNQNDLQIISSYNITRKDPEGKYSCLVQNQHGTGKGFVFYGEFEGTRGITGIVIGCSSAIILVLLLLFMLICYIYKKKQNPAQGNSTQPDVELHEPGQREDSSYMGLKKKKNRDEPQSQLYETLGC